MPVRNQILRWRCLAALTASVLLVAGCRSPASGPGEAAAKPNLGPPVQDARTEARILELENEYIAAKNSRPTHQHEVEAEAARKAKEKAEQEKQQTTPPETTK
jgi:hypothetical protein